ncbi:hypothetical protein [Mucilaginibacter sp. KACC 22063]|uniref:hypothetical protein n=1 Tax=Mucilaginibacter sp. KACC 22063 TaxID=3025666 RepID=UPI0023660AF7|nr:hypothetical protein [Mucilaginibacter sp. KACC 22063]WDF55796.1 hypothetical protein PQ461_01815 [Mucilaginibacter sp. KACC 22063]
MKTIQLNLYHFSELSEEAQKKALADHQDFNVSHNWWDNVYEDAKTVGLKITGFDLDRAWYCNAEYIHDALYTARQISLNHGGKTGTFLTTAEFQLRRDQIVNTWPKDENGEFEQTDGLDNSLDEVENQYLKALCRQYLHILDLEYDYLTSDEAIADVLTANDYWFTADGKIATHLEKLALTA